MPSLLARFAAEPYRLLFAVGLLYVAAAMALWIPAALLGWEQIPITKIHLALIIHGFQACFAVGFLATFAPRVMGAPVTGPAWSFGLTAAGLSGAIVLLVGALAPGAIEPAAVLPWILLTLHVAIATFLGRCVVLGERLPPAPFAVVGLALIGALAADMVSAIDQGMGIVPLWISAAATEFQMQGVLLLMVCGVAPIILPRFAGMAQGSPGACPLDGGRLAALPWIAGGAILLSYPWAAASEYGGWSFRAAWLLRTIGVVLMLRPAIHIPRRVPSFLNAGRVALISIAVGLLLVALMPQWRVAWQHLIFVTGFLWLTMLVGAKVLCAHGGRGPQLERSRWLVWTWSGLLLLANLTRVGAEWAPATRLMHLWLSAVIGLAALLVWGMAYLPLLWRGPQAR